MSDSRTVADIGLWKMLQERFDGNSLGSGGNTAIMRIFRGMEYEPTRLVIVS